MWRCCLILMALPLMDVERIIYNESYLYNMSNELEVTNTSISIAAGLTVLFSSLYAAYKDYEASRPPVIMSVRMNI